MDEVRCRVHPFHVKSSLNTCHSIKCPGCPYGGLDMSRGLFDFFASESVGVLYGTWNYNGGGGDPPPPPPPPSPTTHHTTHTSTYTPPETTTSKPTTHATPTTTSTSTSTTSTSTTTSTTTSDPLIEPTSPVSGPPSSHLIDTIYEAVLALGGVVAAGAQDH